MTAHPILYVTSACTACESALDRLLSMAHPRLLRLAAQEVALNDDLLRRYGARVPVLAYGGRELDWPFGAEDVDRLLQLAASP